MSFRENVRKGISALGLAGIVGGLGGIAYAGLVGEVKSNILAYSDSQTVTSEDIESIQSKYKCRNMSGLTVLAGIGLLYAANRKRRDDDDDEPK
ncbi:MAG: hypothetical protein AABW73_01890 [Nanoarchaeota archaeon]